MGNKSKTIGVAAAAALSCAATQADAAACQQTNFFTDYFSGGPNANCSIGNVTILGNSWNAAAQNAQLETVNFFSTPASNPGIEFFVNTILGAANGAVFTFTVSTPANSPIYMLSFSDNDPTDFASFSVTANGHSAALTGGGTTALTVGPTTSLQITTTITDTLVGANNGPFDNSTASLTYNFSEVPTPEPASFALLGVGLSALGLAKTRGRKRATR